jgi:glycosyltransferase involved in cell wall biosynthesis
MHRVLIIYDQLDVPSTTVRALQFRELFEGHPNFDVGFIGRTSEAMNGFMQRWPWRPSLRRPALYAERKVIERREASIARMARDFDLVMMMTVPSWPLHQRLRDLPNTLLVTDLIDALWLPCFQSHGWEHVHEMLSSSDAVICENQYTADYTAKYNDSVFTIPDSPQVEVFDALRDQVSADRSRITIGWIGGSNTADALFQIYETLDDLFAEHDNLHLRLVGARADRLPRFAFTELSVLETYDQQQMAREALAMDIGLFPLFNVGESLYRGTLKARVYMSGEAAVIGQALGENCDLIQHGENGLLAADRDQWRSCLESLIKDESLRRRLAAGGLQTIRDKYTRQHCFDTLAGCLTEVLQRN